MRDENVDLAPYLAYRELRGVSNVIGLLTDRMDAIEAEQGPVRTVGTFGNVIDALLDYMYWDEDEDVYIPLNSYIGVRDSDEDIQQVIDFLDNEAPNATWAWDTSSTMTVLAEVLNKYLDRDRVTV